MRIGPRDRILELNCGEGQASIELARRVPEGVVVALDRSDDNVHAARVRARGMDNILFAAMERDVPWNRDFFSKALSHGMPENPAEVWRVLLPAGELYIEIAGGADSSPETAELEAAGFREIAGHPLPGNHSLLVGKKPPADV